MNASAPAAYLTADASLAEVEETVLAIGVLQPKKIINVGAQASGRITRMHVALGDQVNKGSVIAEIDPATEQNALNTARATLERRKAQQAATEAKLRLAEIAHRRSKTTLAANLTSKADYEDTEAALAQAQADISVLDAEIRAAEIAVDTARVHLGYTQVLAPLDGTVIAILAPEGQTVNAVQSAPTIVKLANLNIMTVKAKISEADVPKVRAGLPVYFNILGAPERRYTSALAAVEPAPETLALEQNSPGAADVRNNAVYYNGLFDVPNPDGTLRPLMTAEVRIVLRRAENTLTVPSAALQEFLADGAAVVLSVEESGAPVRRIVRVGIDNGISAQIVQGLSPGEKVVVGTPRPATAR